jgi:hypothetical protein
MAERRVPKPKTSATGSKKGTRSNVSRVAHFKSPAAAAGLPSIEVTGVGDECIGRFKAWLRAVGASEPIVALAAGDLGEVMMEDLKRRFLALPRSEQNDYIADMRAGVSEGRKILRALGK